MGPNDFWTEQGEFLDSNSYLAFYLMVHVEI